MNLPHNAGPIGVFDSGYGGLTILHGIRQLLQQYDYMYLGTTPVPLTARDPLRWCMSLRVRPY